MRSIHAFLLTRLLGGAALVLALAGVAVFLFTARSLERQFDRNLLDRRQALASILFQVEDELSFEFSEELMPEYARAERPAFFELSFADGRPIEGSDSLAGGALEVPAEVTTEPLLWTAALPDGRTGRYLAQLVEVHHVYPEEGPDRPTAAVVRIVVARGREELIAAERSLLRSCVAGGLLLLILIAAIAWHAVSRGLRPTRRLIATLETVQADHLPTSLDVGPLPAELQPIAATADALVRRLDAALQRERRTTADIAHELRTPISELITAAEVALRDRDDPAGAFRALGAVHAIAWRMGRTVSTLLALSRLDAQTERFEPEPVDLRALLDGILRAQSAQARERDLTVELDLAPAHDLGTELGRAEAAAPAASPGRNGRPDTGSGQAPGPPLEAPPDVLRILLSNLLSNALQEAPPGGVVRCASTATPDGWSVQVENETDALADPDLAFLTDPFWRKDSARTDRNRSGLGLALSRALAEGAGLELTFALDGRRFRARVAGPPAHARSDARPREVGPVGLEPTTYRL